MGLGRFAMMEQSLLRRRKALLRPFINARGYGSHFTTVIHDKG